MPTSLYRNSLTDALFERAREFVGLYDVEKRWFTHVNEAGYRLLGYPSAQALYDDPERNLRVQRHTLAEWEELKQRVARYGHHEEEVELRCHTGSSFWAHLELSGLMLGEHSYYLVRITDTNRLHQAERHLAHSVGRFEAVFSSATIGIIVCDRRGNIVLANPQAQRQFGYPADTLRGQGVELLMPEAVGQFHAQLRASFNPDSQARATGSQRDLWARRRDGSVFPVEISLSYFHLDDELFVVAYVIDVTFKHEAERQLRAQHQQVAQLNAELEHKVADRTRALAATLAELEQRTHELTQALAAEQQLSELKSRFVSMASHEFRTPLTAVLNSAILAEKYTTTEQQPQRRRHLAHIRTSVKHLTDILEEFLSVDKLEQGRFDVRPGRANVPHILQEAVAEVQGLRRPSQHIEQVVSGPPTLWLDASLLRKILVNLLSNALKYSPDDARVCVQAVAQARVLTVRVRDEGLGISAADQVHLFERFFRSPGVAHIPGTGLGLYIVTKYLELLGGTIALHSELHVGTTFTITLPYEEDHSTN